MLKKDKRPTRIYPDSRPTATRSAEAVDNSGNEQKENATKKTSE